MTLLFFDGLQDAAVVPKPEWDITVPWLAALGRDGSTNGGACISGQQSAKTLTLPSAAATCIVGFAFACSSVSNFGTSAYILMGFVRSTTLELVLTVNANGYLEVRRTSPTGTLLGTSSGHDPLVTSVWHHIQMKVLLHTSTGTVDVKLNGVTVLSLTGQVTAGTSGSVAALRVTTANSNGSSTIWDELWVCDEVDASATQGGANNDFLGDLKITTLLPTGAGDTTGMTPSAGSNYQCVDEVPPTTADYVSHATATTRDLYAVNDLTAAAGTVYGVRIGLYAAKSDAGAKSICPVIKENSTVTTQASQALSTSYTKYYGPMLPVKPSASNTRFTASDVNGTQIGAEVAA